MGNNWTKIQNNTPYPISYVCAHQVSAYTAQGHGTVEPQCEETAWHAGLPCYIYLKHGSGRTADECTQNYDTYWWYNGINCRTFTITERASDSSELELKCDSGENHYLTFPNHGRIEAERLEKQREDERRRQQRIEREKQIREEIENEIKALEEKNSQILEELQERRNQSRETHKDVHLQRSAGKCNGSSFQYNEIKHINEEFNQLLMKYNVQEVETIKSKNIFERISAVRYLMISEYAKKNKLPVYYLQDLGCKTDFISISLAENFVLLKVMIEITLEDSNNGNSTQNHGHKIQDTRSGDATSDFLFCIVERLCKENRTLATKLLKQITNTLSETSQEYISTIVFNNIWSPAQALQFYFAEKAQADVEEILDLVQTYWLPLHHVIDFLKQPRPILYLKRKCTEKKDKHVTTLMREMRHLKYPEGILNILKNVLQGVTDRLKNDKLLNEPKDIKEVIKSINDINFNSPEKLVDILVHLAKAVKEATSDQENNIRGYFPRTTQLASLLVLLQPNEMDCKGRLMEIGTGEGKSCIVAMFALIQAIRGKEVDIITSSPVLACRDQEEWMKLFDMFGINSSVIPPRGLDKCTDSQDRDKLIQDAYRAQVVYGTVEDFAADILRQDFEKQQTRGSRKFDMAIVDEVDHMTLDSGVQVTFLTHEVTGLRHLDQVLAAIWAKVCACQRIVETDTGEILWMSGIQFFHTLAVSAVFGKDPPEHCGPTDILMRGVEMGHFRDDDLKNATAEDNSSESNSPYAENKKLENLIRKFGPSQQKDLFTDFGKYLGDMIKFKFYEFKDGKVCFWEDSGASEEEETISVLLMENGLACLLMPEKDLIDATVKELTSLVTYSDSDTLCDGKILPKAESMEKEANNDTLPHGIILPKHLKEYTHNRLPIFVENALRALVMEKGREYTLDCRDILESPESLSVIPIDFISTGVLEKNKRWGDGLQQFLEIKHQLALTPLSTVTNFMSNFHFFQKYNQGGGISGVSGTLGDENDCAFLRKHYKTASYVMPTHCFTKRLELPAVQVEGGREVWITEICKCVTMRIRGKARKKGQVALVICEDVITAEEIRKKLLEQDVAANKITMYTRSDKDNVEMKTFDSGDIILSTNLGGRGTDIKVTNQVNLSGGLSVILTHFPANRRIEKQIFGRTSRKGNPGMVQMILNPQDMAPLYQNQPVEIMRRLRVKDEEKRILEMEQNELREVDIRQELFTYFCNFLEEVCDKYSEKEMGGACCDIKFDYKIALNALKETWAVWLTLHEEDINNHKAVEELKNDLKVVLKQRAEDILEGKSENFYDFVKLATDRTHLHIRDKSKDHGALGYWEKVASIDPVYRAISLYNQAFITINMRQKGYRETSMELLKEAKESLGIFVLETFNTNLLGKIADTDKFDKYPNLTLQMETRVNLLKTWADGITESLKKLESLEEGNNDVKTEEISIFNLSATSGKVASDEVSILYDCGLSFIFEMEKKPGFAYSPHVCLLLGATQICSGALICAVSMEVGSSFGVTFIEEGVRDMISVITGMVTDDFNWTEWAISKTIRILMSLGSFGLNAAKKSVSAATICGGRRVQNLSPVARTMATSGSRALSAVTKTLTKEGLMKGLKHTAIEITKAFKKKEGLYVLNAGMQKAIEATLDKILGKCLRSKVTDFVKSNKELETKLTDFVIERAVPALVLKTENPSDFIIKANFEEKVKAMVKEVSTSAITEAFRDNVYTQMLQTGIRSAIPYILKALNNSCEILNVLDEYKERLEDVFLSLPTESLTDKLVTSIIKQTSSDSCCSEDERRQIADVTRLTHDLQDIISDLIATEYFHFLSSLIMNSVKSTYESEAKRATKEVLNDAAAELISNPFNRILANQEVNRSKIPLHPARPLYGTQTDPSVEDVIAYMKNLEEKHLPTELELHALTKTRLLNGKGIQLTMVGNDGKTLSTRCYPGAVPTSGNIVLQVKESSTPGQFSFSLEKGGSHYSGLLRPEKEMGLYEALNGSVVKNNPQTLINLREEVKKEVLGNLDTYIPIMKKDLQRENIINLSKSYHLPDEND